jgi:hypothetical protein
MHWMSTGITLVMQTLLSVAVTITVRLSFMGSKTPAYQPSVVLLCTELVKLTLSWGMIFLSDAPTADSKEIAHGVYYALPAFLYSVSNAIIFFTVGVISPGEFVLLWQSKIAATALLYRFVLKRPISSMQWLALLGVIVGVIIIEWSIGTTATATAATVNATVATVATSTTTSILNVLVTSTKKPPPHPQSTLELASNDPCELEQMTREFAILITLAGATVAAFAGICAEWVYKSSTENIWRQNSRLYLAELMFYVLSSLIQSHGHIDLNYTTIFQGFNAYCVALIFLQSFLGFGIGFVLKYFDVILGLQSAAAATVVNVFVSMLYFDLTTKYLPLFWFGAFMVIFSIYTYHVNKVVDGVEPTPSLQHGPDAHSSVNVSRNVSDSAVSVSYPESGEQDHLLNRKRSRSRSVDSWTSN